VAAHTQLATGHPARQSMITIASAGHRASLDDNIERLHRRKRSIAPQRANSGWKINDCGSATLGCPP